MTARAASPQTHQPPLRAGAIITLAIGAVLTVFGPILGILIGSFALVPRAIGLGEDTTRIAPTGTVELGAGETVFLLAPVADLSAVVHSDCTAQAGDGTATVSYEPASALNTLVAGVRYESFASVTADRPGSYTLTCDTTVDVVTAPPFELGPFVGLLGWWGAAGILASLVGIVLVIVGIVRLTRTPRSV